MSELRLGGTQKAAALLLAMGAPLASRVLKHFDNAALKHVTRAAADLGTVPFGVLEGLTEEFTQAYVTGPDLCGDLDRATALLHGVPELPVSEIISGALGAADVDVWMALSRLPEASLVAFLQRERIATVTYVLSRMEPEAVSRVIALLDRNARNDVLCGLIPPPRLSEFASRVVEETLRQELLMSDALQKEKERRSRVAAIINTLDPDEAAAAMDAFSQSRPEEAEQLKSMLFTFTDLPKMSLRSRAILFDKLSTGLVVLALRGMDEDFRNAALASMASRARRLVEGELSSGVAVPQKDISNARKEVARIALDMASRGEIELGATEGA